MAVRWSRLAGAGLLGLLLVGCGDGGSDTPGSAEPPAETTSVDPTDLEKYLLLADEVPDLTPILKPQTMTGEPFPLPDGGAEVLESTGYISSTYQPAEGDNGAGVSSVTLFETEAGAQDWMAYETTDEVILHQIPNADIERFEVSEIPGAHGWTGPDLHGNAIGHLFWTQGRCMMLIGLEVEGPRIERLTAGAKAIYERTGGTCPG
jgi:hypothetical protein